ncbi:hypothetical protein C8Q76DRAFT_789896 [Earliella scabrosa]|nr:hypothetical protein C8Q76DRAFT_789896 [Earliella scabrosa]
MHFSSLLSSLLPIAAIAGTVRAVTPSPVPGFETLFVGTYGIGDIDMIQGPFGTRVHVVVTGGNFTDVNGNLVATMLPTADTGLIGSTGSFFPDMVMPLRWAADGKLAHLYVTGVGTIGQTDLSYIHLETDSPTYRALNDRFLITNITFPGGPTTDPVMTIYGAL